MGHASVPELAQSMKLEWSDEALADLDRFAEFLDREHPSLSAICRHRNYRQGAGIVRTSVARSADCWPGRISPDRIAGSRRGLRDSISNQKRAAGIAAPVSCA